VGFCYYYRRERKIKGKHTSNNKNNMCIALLSLGDKPHGSMVFRVTDKIFLFFEGRKWNGRPFDDDGCIINER
jgi:hypothetical protein